MGHAGNLRVAEPEKQYPTSIFFYDFLPKEAVSVGTSWEIEHVGALELLKQLHPSPSLGMRAELPPHKKPNLKDCGHASAPTMLNSLTLCSVSNAQFDLKDGWFTPSQFTGHLVIDRIKRSVAFFQMSVPKGTINFGAKWKIDPDEEGHITDSGFCPQMELRAGIENVGRNTEFIESITQEEVEHKLSLCFYKSHPAN